LARDFFAKVIPGAIVLFTIIMSSTDPPIKPESLFKLSIGAWLFLYGVCYAVGFAVQAAGEWFGWVRAYPGDETEGDFRTRLVRFSKSLEGIKKEVAEDYKQQRERYVVIKEMAGNVSLSVAISFIIWIVVSLGKILPDQISISLSSAVVTQVFFIVLVVICIVALFWFQKVHQRRQRDLELKVIKEAPDNENSQKENP